MESVIIKPKNEILKKYIQYFLYFKKTDFNFFSYATFPNNNLCLAIYKDNDINYIKKRDKNQCIIKRGNGSFKSKLFGFHKMRFNVDINGTLDQICILFHPAALSAFTRESYGDLIDANEVFGIFKNKDDYILEQIFEESDFSKRTDKLERLLLDNLNDHRPLKMKEALYLIEKGGDHHLPIEGLAKELAISTPTLFRLFKNNVGLSPKSFLKTLRFRNILNEIIYKRCSLTSTAYSHLYYDQAHFINDFKSFSGYSPNQLIHKISIENKDLTWICNKK
jgi:AraC-like DNA-binding protein